MPTKNKRLTYKIDSRICDDMLRIRSRMKESIQYGRPVAIICLLGEKDNLIDYFEPIISSNGCWDAPEVSYKQFDSAFKKMVKKDRTVVGMALVRPEGYSELITNDLKRNIHAMRHTFSDITRTIWLMVSDKGIYAYRAYKDARGRLSIKSYNSKTLYVRPKESKLLSSMEFFKKASAAEASIDERYEARKKAKRMVSSIRYIPKKKPKVKSPVSSLPSGYSFLKLPDGKEILWRTS